ncbi:MAG: hypothetical protein QNJ11_18960 [Woeseiaceae bacterium]|nr:hypothetical protein [Woeseiaceae bacterium]
MASTTTRLEQIRLRIFVKNLPRRGAIEQSDRDVGDDRWIVDVAEIHSAHVGAI